MMKRVLVLTQIMLASIGLYSQVNKIDSLKALLETHKKADTIRVNLFNEISYQTIGVDYYKAREYAQQGLELAMHLSHHRGIVIAKSRLAGCYWILGHGELAIDHALSAIEIVKKEKIDSAILADTYRILGVTYMDQGELTKAEHYLGIAEKLCWHTKNWSILLRVYVGAGIVQLEKKKPDSALSLFLKSESVEKEHPNLYYLPVIYTNIGSIYGDQTNYDPKKELDYYYKALSLSEKAQNYYAKARVLSRLGQAMLREKEFASSENYLKKSQQIARSIGLKTVVRDNYLHLMNLKMRQGNFLQSSAYQKAYYDLRDSLSNEKKTREIVELETRHEREKKQQEIKLLTQEKRNASILRNSLLMGLGLTILFGAVLYNLQQKKNQKAKQLLAFQKTLNDKLKETDALKSRFFANISHEFRTPLSLIIAPVEEKLMLPGQVGIDKESSKLILRNAKRLLTLVNQILDLSKLEAKKMELQVRLGNLETFLKIVTASFELVAHKKKIIFSRHIHLYNPEIEFDADKIETIVTNLLINSFKFTPAGGTVNIAVREFTEEKQIKITIADTGIGIPEEDKQHLFSPFYQVREIHDGDLGTGLGLSLVKELVKLHEGSIDLESTINQGTTITVVLPIHKTALSQAVPLSDSDLALREVMSDDLITTENESSNSLDEEEKPGKQTILVVEDNRDLQRYLESMLNKQYTVMVAQDGEDGLEHAYQHIPDLIVSDVMMPKLNGTDLTERIKNDERTSHIPIILLTAKADLESRLDGLKMGADDYLAKPFAVEELLVRIANLLNQRKKLAEKYMSGLSVPSSAPVMREISMDEKFLQKAKSLVESNIGDSLFGVELMADGMNLSRAQLFRKLKAISGLSPNEFINDIRLLRAAEMIKAKVDTLTQISYSVGFNEQSYFAKRFKKKFGVTPSEYGK
jgi:signal transduction histidine kinase/DNA-binding response OmpR family regulator